MLRNHIKLITGFLEMMQLKVVQCAFDNSDPVRDRAFECNTFFFEQSHLDTLKVIFVFVNTVFSMSAHVYIRHEQGMTTKFNGYNADLSGVNPRFEFATFTEVSWAAAFMVPPFMLFTPLRGHWVNEFTSDHRAAKAVFKIFAVGRYLDGTIQRIESHFLQTFQAEFFTVKNIVDKVTGVEITAFKKGDLVTIWVYDGFELGKKVIKNKSEILEIDPVVQGHVVVFEHGDNAVLSMFMDTF